MLGIYWEYSRYYLVVVKREMIIVNIWYYNCYIVRVRKLVGGGCI